MLAQLRQLVFRHSAFGQSKVETDYLVEALGFAQVSAIEKKPENISIRDFLGQTLGLIEDVSRRFVIAPFDLEIVVHEVKRIVDLIDRKTKTLRAGSGRHRMD